jgi:hypothetical protein
VYARLEVIARHDSQAKRSPESSYSSLQGLYDFKTYAGRAKPFVLRIGYANVKRLPKRESQNPSHVPFKAYAD